MTRAALLALALLSLTGCSCALTGLAVATAVVTHDPGHAITPAAVDCAECLARLTRR